MKYRVAFEKIECWEYEIEAESQEKASEIADNYPEWNFPFKVKKVTDISFEFLFCDKVREKVKL